MFVLASSLVVALLSISSHMLVQTQEAEEKSPNDLSYQLVDGYEDLLAAPLVLDFSCAGREYGYYADIANACQIFHICLPLKDDLGTVYDTAHWSFICGNGTVFDQESLACHYVEAAIPCEESESLYNAVEFGLKEDATAGDDQGDGQGYEGY